MAEDAVSSFEEFFSEKMRDELNALAAAFPEKRSLNVDYSLLEKFNPSLADALLENPDAVIAAANTAASRISVFQEKKIESHIRFLNLPEASEVDVQNLGANQLNKLIRVRGVVSWITMILPLMKTAVWECVHCGNTVKTSSEKNVVRPPGLCNCGRRREAFRLVEQSSEFINIQRAGLQEPVEKLRGSTPASSIELWLEDDLVNVIAPGEKLIVTGILRLKPKSAREAKGRSSVYDKFLDVNHICKELREFEEISISKEEEKKIIELSKNPRLYELITQSIAPRIYGYDELKQALALQLFGGTPNKVLPDKGRIRSDFHVLLVGDPGCLVGDERVVLGNGAIVKISELGEKHLQEISQPMLTGQGYARAVAKVFHIYKNQPVMEVVTESGKSIKGTLNHPLLVVEKQVRSWKRLDEIRAGDRLAVVPWIPCTITALRPTGWARPKQTLDPKNKAVLPQKLSPRLSGLLGYLLGNGWVTRTRFAFNVNLEEKDLLPLLKKIIKKEFKLDPHVSVRKRINRKPILAVQVESTAVASNLFFLKEKRIPGLVMRSSNAVASEFLSWLFEADGCVFSKGRGRRAIQLKSSGAELLRDVQILLLRFGIHSRVIGRNLVIRHAKSIKKFAEAIGFKSAKKKRQLKELVKAVKDLHHEFGKQLSERVVSVKKAGYADVFDVEIPETHRFIANGVISHNTAKSVTLEYVSKLAPKSIFVSGGGASGVGLTAAAERDAEGGWVLKAGAMVLANGGLAVIDEFDKMSDEDRGLMHQAMEQQMVSIAKAGIVTQFQARTAVLAAANPQFGRFDPTKPPAQQFNVSPGLMSRFDLIFTIRDILDEKRDREMAEHILLGHKYAADKTISPPPESALLPAIPIELLQKYIAYARKNVFPTMSEEAMDKIKEFYIELRRLGVKQENYPVTARQIEAIIRLAEAVAKARLSPRVELQDAERAISLINYVLRDVFMDKETGRIDSDIIYVGQPKNKIDKMRSVMEIISSLEKKIDLVSKEDVVREAVTLGIDSKYVEQLIDLLLRQGDLYSPRPGFIRSARKKWE